MTFEDWMRSERKTIDDSMEFRLLRRCWQAAQSAERKRWRDAINALAGSWDDPAEAYGMRLALNEGLKV